MFILLLLLFLSAAPTRGRHSGSAVSNFSWSSYPYLTLQPLACPLLPHPWTLSLVFLFSFYLAAPSTTSFYQYTLHSVSARAQPSFPNFVSNLSSLLTWAVPRINSFLILSIHTAAGFSELWRCAPDLRTCVRLIFDQTHKILFCNST